jgi:cytoskeletal protein CcmA (bactofilin family)
MKNEKNNESTEETPAVNEQNAPADALSRTPDDLAQEESIHTVTPTNDVESKTSKKRLSRLKRFFRRINLYFLLFLLIVILVSAIAIVNYLNSQKSTPQPDLVNQGLTTESLKQLANTDASVGSASQTLTIQGNAVIDGQTLARGNLNVAGNFQSGGSIQGPSITISGQANLGQVQINSLQVATNVAVQGDTTLRDLSVSGASTFSGPLTASQITVSRLVLSGNAVLHIPNHISFTGPAPSRTLGNALGNGGSASLNGSDTAGTVNINTGSNPNAGCYVRVNFNQNFTSQPHVIISPVGAGAALSQYYVDRNTSGFSICNAGTPPANQTFAFDYFVSH